ncbi:hypothetical protein FHX82_000184 [Amycolatopsis bartoniae]|uniref:Uncharacterized protein n=1 Tax=Amycolatopsis bartoniae TaxID=941986 RepID=A0A8H9IYG6_9PSEU|nr:DUF6461 domain-containing protein [Amycolatopsis bartoniae]MBB2933164.1 hypothetical protein [Amycolatopsis bartoniae]TVT11845.1 hypothetical protein FNH07_00515 [Amycolatopsis bartoniae]GHF57536.1 hypothetical protein GCM10017566_33450 [Amycolatopsis bartoniae]
MPTPSFPPDTLDPEGTPLWIAELANDDPNHALHVVRGLEPAEVLDALGVKPHLVRPCELPAEKPDEWTSLPGAALGVKPGTAAALVAGRVGEWTFVYDDSGHTVSDEETVALSVGGRAAATSVFTINADTSLVYAVDGEEVANINGDNLDLAEDLPGLPPELRTAFEVAGTVELDYLEPGEPDYDILMRAICALAGLTFTPDELRRLPLLGAILG